MRDTILIMDTNTTVSNNTNLLSMMKYTQLMVHFLVKLFKVLGQKLQKKLMNELENI